MSALAVCEADDSVAFVGTAARLAGVRSAEGVLAGSVFTMRRLTLGTNSTFPGSTVVMVAGRLTKAGVEIEIGAGSVEVSKARRLLELLESGSSRLPTTSFSNGDDGSAELNRRGVDETIGAAPEIGGGCGTADDRLVTSRFESVEVDAVAPDREFGSRIGVAWRDAVLPGCAP